MANVKIFKTHKGTGERTEIKDMYWFEENFVHDFMGEVYYGEGWRFDLEVDGVKIPITTCTEWTP